MRDPIASRNIISITHNSQCRNKNKMVCKVKLVIKIKSTWWKMEVGTKCEQKNNLILFPQLSIEINIYIKDNQN